MGTHAACQFRYNAENADSSLKGCHPIIPSGRAFTEGICRHMVGSLTSVIAGCLQGLFYAYASKETVGHGTVSFQELVVRMTFNHCSLTQKCLLQLYNFFSGKFQEQDGSKLLSMAWQIEPPSTLGENILEPETFRIHVHVFSLCMVPF